ncbi:cyanate transporter [Pusillimonas minor]|uniref:Cyanate transporter n=1 Tax=Pusillimonas minor TaxID=2697024 RepID=A0A842HSY7_9BURK|nr:cyanate transporter [Pusillimonas minor]MBC2770530.1 cyanate transporter [Pusillimonas minor]
MSSVHNAQSARSASTAVLLAAVVLIGLNLRPFITGVGPLAADISQATGLDLKGISLLTLVPMLLMGVFAFAGPVLQARIGGRLSMMAALGLLVVGSFLRLFTTNGWQLVGTAALLGLGAAVVQAVLPGVVKRQLPQHVGVVMGLYSAMLMGGGALGAQVSPWVAAVSGTWHIGLAWMALPAALALALVARYLPRDVPILPARLSLAAYLRRPRVWLLMVCFGLVNGGYSTTVAWLAPFYREYGWSASASGGLLAYLSVCQALTAISLPILARKGKDRRPWLWLALAMQAAGFAGLAFWPLAAPLIWAMLLGAGLGGCFALSLIVALDHLPDPTQAGTLSALMQGGGFLIAAMPPWIVAALHESTGGFSAGWVMHLGCAVVVAILYWRVSPASYARGMNMASKTANVGK